MTSGAEAAAPEATRPRQGGAARSWLLGAVLLGPSVWWVAVDRSVWSWDPALYGAGAVDLWRTLTSDPSAWWKGMRSALYGAKPPGIAWAGQLLVPLGRGIGSVESGLLALVLVSALGTLVLTYGLGRRIAPGSALAPALGVLFLAASPLFTAFSHHFMTEALQLFAVAYVYWVAAASRTWPPARTLAHLVLGVTLGALAKINTPMYVVLPAALAGWRALQAGRARGGWRQLAPRDAVAAALAVASVSVASSWYMRNWKGALDFAKFAASSEVALEFGRRDTFVHKLGHWARALAESFLAAETPWVLLALAAVGFAAARARPRALPGEPAGKGDPPLAIAACLQLAIVLAVFASMVNEETRFALALGPTLVAIGLGGVPALRRGGVTAMVAALALVVQWGIVHARALGALSVRDGSFRFWASPPASDAALMREVSRTADLTCDERSSGQPKVIVGVSTVWMNALTLTFYAAKGALESGVRCHYDDLGHAPTDVDAAYASIVAPGALSYVVLLEPAGLEGAPESLNRVALPLLRRVEDDPRFRRVPFDSAAHIAVFGRAPSER